MSWPAGLLAFRKCPISGCIVDVYGPTSGDPSHCATHGGDPSFPQVPEADEWGEPQHDFPGAADTGGPLPLPVSRPPSPED